VKAPSSREEGAAGGGGGLGEDGLAREEEKERGEDEMKKS